MKLAGFETYGFALGIRALRIFLVSWVLRGGSFEIKLLKFTGSYPLNSFSGSPSMPVRFTRPVRCILNAAFDFLDHL